MGTGIEGLVHADGLQPAEDIGDVLMLLGEDFLGEADDGPGDGCVHCQAQGVAVAQDLQEYPAEGLQGEGVCVELLVLVVQGGDWDDDAFGDVQEQLVQLRSETVQAVSTSRACTARM